MKIIKGKQAKARRVLLYGTHGVGKSTWASESPKPIFMQTEDGLDDIGVDRTPVLKSMGDLNSALSHLASQPHDYQTIVIDTLDWLERLIWKATCAKHSKSSIEDFGYGKGYKLALDGWDWVLENLNHLRSERGMNIVLLAHACVVKHEPPDGDSYGRYEPDLHRSVSPMLQEWCDEVLFAGYEVNTVTEDLGFNKERTRAIGSGDRLVYTSEMPTHLAKRRIQLPDTIPLYWQAYYDAWPARDKSNVSGLVVDGSSKTKGKTDGKS